MQHTSFIALLASYKIQHSVKFAFLPHRPNCGAWANIINIASKEVCKTDCRWQHQLYLVTKGPCSFAQVALLGFPFLALHCTSTVKFYRVVKEGLQIPLHQVSLLCLTQLNSLTNYFSKFKYGLTCCCFHVLLCSEVWYIIWGYYLRYYFSLKRKDPSFQQILVN
jgi:hypothetical protein